MKSIIIGIAGGTGSGKTTLTERLRDHFGADEVSVLNHDSNLSSLTEHRSPHWVSVIICCSFIVTLFFLIQLSEPSPRVLKAFGCKVTMRQGIESNILSDTCKVSLKIALSLRILAVYRTYFSRICFIRMSMSFLLLKMPLLLARLSADEKLERVCGLFFPCNRMEPLRSRTVCQQRLTRFMALRQSKK